MKPITADDIITWLRELPPDTLVYNGEDSPRFCTVGTYAYRVRDVLDPSPGYTCVGTDGESIPLDDLEELIKAWDACADQTGLTAAQALDAVKELIS